MVPSCMSLFRLGSMMQTVGNWLKFVGKFEKGWLSADGIKFPPFPCQFTQGACFRAYPPEEQVVEPVEGRSSEYPTNVRLLCNNCAPRLAVVKLCGQESSVTPW